MLKRTRFLALIIIATLILLATLLAWFLPLFGRPLPRHSTRTQPASPEPQMTQQTPTADSGTTPTPGQDPASNLSAVPTATLAPPGKPACRGPESLTLLVLGIDQNAQADAIRLVRLDFRQEAIAVLAIPRDFYVPIVDMTQHGITQGRINAAYGYGEWFNGRGGGVISVADNIAHNFGVHVDHYLVLSFANIADYIDRVGGVQIELEQTVADGRHIFHSGLHHLDGETAVTFMRMRYYDSDFARIRRQSMVISAFYNQAMQELNLFEQTQLAMKGLLDRNIRSDLALKDLSPLICLARAVDKRNVAFVEIPSELYTPHTTSGGASVQIPSDGVAPFIQSVMDGGYLQPGE